jgi:hypothetical protein
MKAESKQEAVKRVLKRVALGLWYVWAAASCIVAAAIWIAIVIGGWPGGAGQ